MPEDPGKKIMAKNLKTTNKRSSATDRNNRKKKNNNLPLLIAAVVVLCIVGAVAVLQRGGNTENPPADTRISASDAKASSSSPAKSGEEDAEEEEIQVIGEGESLVIPVSDISSTAVFYPVEVDGTRMEILAVEDSEGNIRTAFNTCQICYGSGRGYYVQNGDVLVCQNCGNRFTVDQVEIESGGCNPWPIFAENKTVTEDSIEISYDFLKESQNIFANWKVNY